MNASWILIEVTVILALALIGTRLARRSRAAVRHVLLASAFGGLLILPLASMVAPAVQVEVPAAVHAVIAPLDADPISMELTPQAVAEATAPPQTPARREWSWPSLSTLLFGAWIAGAVLFLAPVAVGLWQVRALRRSGLPWRDAGVTTIALADRLGVRRSIEVLRHESVPGPMTCGLVRPAIVLPMDAVSWAPEDLQRAVVHELEHVRRADWLTHCLARVVAACYWFHPVIWVAWRQLVLEAERACDDAVLRESEATAYADQLVLLAQRLSHASSQPQLAMANRRDLTTRVRAVLDGAQRRGKAGAIWVGVAIAVCTLLVGTMSPLRIVAASAGPDSQGVTQSERFDVVSVKPCAGDAPPTAAAPARSGGRGGVAPWHAQTSPGSVRWDCVTLATLVDQAYADRDRPLLNITGDSRPPRTDGLGPIRPKRVRGGPAWVETDKFTIEARASLDLTNPALAGSSSRNLAALPAKMSQALRAVLEDRFQLKVRRATEQQDMYAMTVAKGGLNNERMKATTPGDCVTSDEYFAADPASRGNLRICGRYFVTMGRWEFGGGTLKELAAALSSIMELFVLDQTGVDSRFTYVLDLADRTSQGDDRFITALEKLGLRMARTKGPAEYLVIDSVQRLRPDNPAYAAAQARKFDVASVRPCDSDPPQTGRIGGAAQASPGYLFLPCQTLRQMVNLAYDVASLLNKPYGPGGVADVPALIRGGPSWAYSERFTIEAKVAGIADPETLTTRTGQWAVKDSRMAAMLRSLLEDRFQLKTHRATEDQTMYALTVAKSGLKIKPIAPGHCWEFVPGKPAPPHEKGVPSCGVGGNGWGSYEFRGVKFGGSAPPEGRRFADHLFFMVRRMVIDRTGLDGRYSFALEFTPDDSTPGQNGRCGGDPGCMASLAANGVSDTRPETFRSGDTIFKALERLGLTLELVGAPAEYIVIDRAERPKPNTPASAEASAGQARR